MTTDDELPLPARTATAVYVVGGSLVMVATLMSLAVLAKAAGYPLG